MKVRKQKNNIETQFEKTSNSILKFSRFITEFSKWLSLVFTSVYVFNLTMSWITYFIKDAFPTEILDYVLQPTLIILGFYFSTKMFENVSKIICGHLSKKFGIENNSE